MEGSTMPCLFFPFKDISISRCQLAKLSTPASFLETKSTLVCSLGWRKKAWLGGTKDLGRGGWLERP